MQVYYDRGQTKKIQRKTIGKSDDDGGLGRHARKAQWGREGRVDDVMVFRFGHEGWEDQVTHMVGWGNVYAK